MVIGSLGLPRTGLTKPYVRFNDVWRASKPTMFIGSSVEGKRVAEQIQESLEYEVDSTVWHQGVFGLSGGTLETLVNALDEYDFATFVLTADDLIEKRDISGRSPRDVHSRAWAQVR
jgi:predicted nucleotide-binding protein